MSRQALDELIAGFHEQYPQAMFTLESPIDQHHNHLRFTWRLYLACGNLVEGMDYGELVRMAGLS